MNLIKEMIKNKYGIISLIVFAIIGYLYIRSIYLGLILEFLYVEIFAILFVILFSLNFSLITFIIINYKKFHKGSLVSFISALFGFVGLQGCLVGCGTGSFAILLATIAPLFKLNMFELGVILLIISDILFILNLYFLLGFNKKKNVTKLKITNSLNKKDSENNKS
ncbi:MAG: hypothetical protein ACP5GJ_02085 [Nanopusillaceae archaeon]